MQPQAHAQRESKATRYRALGKPSFGGRWPAQTSRSEQERPRLDPECEAAQQSQKLGVIRWLR
jgi:hypothetical protein